MDMETPLMLLFVCNDTEQASVMADTKQMLDLALDDIEQNGMLPKEFECKDIPLFTICLNVPRAPSERKPTTNKGYDHYKEHGKKAFHFEVAKEDISFFKFLSAHTHRMHLDVKYFVIFTKFTCTFTNNAPLSDCTRLHQCIHGHLNFHLSSVSIMLNGIDMLDASEYLCKPTSGKSIVNLSLRDVLYRITLENKSPLFLQLSQRLSGEVDVVIPNTPEAELLAEKMNVQIAACCHFYWKETNPGAERFYRKLSDRAFNQDLHHEICDCTWDSSTKTVTSPSAQSEMSALAEFEQQDWVRFLAKDNNNRQSTRAHVSPNVAFPFQDDFSVGTKNGANVTNHSAEKVAAVKEADVIEIQDDKDDVSVLTTKTHKDQTEDAVGSRIATGPNPVSGPTAAFTQAVTDTGGSEDPSSVGKAGGAAGRPMGK